MIKHDSLLEKISTLQAKDEDKIQYKLVREMISEWSRRINSYNERIGVIKKSVETR